MPFPGRGLFDSATGRLHSQHGGNVETGDVTKTNPPYLLCEMTKQLMMQRVDSMTQFDSPRLTAAEIRSIEAHARQLRSEAMHDIMRALGRKLAALPQKIAGLFHRPRHA